MRRAAQPPLIHPLQPRKVSSASSTDLVNHMNSVQQSTKAISGARLRWHRPPTQFLVVLKKARRTHVHALLTREQDDADALSKFRVFVAWVLAAVPHASVYLEAQQFTDSIAALSTPEFESNIAHVHPWPAALVMT